MIPEDMIMRHLDLLLASSEPGASLHHLVVVAAPPDALGPLGLPDEKRLDTTVYVIAADPDVSAEEFIAQVVMAAAVEAHCKNTIPLFAALNQEVWMVDLPYDSNNLEARRLGSRLMREGRLREHPDAAEVTVVYGACRDGRRWRGQRWLTGPRAGTTEQVDLLVGWPQPDEASVIPAAPLVRQLVGMTR